MRCTDRTDRAQQRVRALDYRVLATAPNAIDAVAWRRWTHVLFFHRRRRRDAFTYWQICMASVLDGDVRWSNDTIAVDLSGFRWNQWLTTVNIWINKRDGVNEKEKKDNALCFRFSFKYKSTRFIWISDKRNDDEHWMRHHWHDAKLMSHDVWIHGVPHVFPTTNGKRDIIGIPESLRVSSVTV